MDVTIQTKKKKNRKKKKTIERGRDGEDPN